MGYIIIVYVSFMAISNIMKNYICQKILFESIQTKSDEKICIRQNCMKQNF